MNVKLNDDVSYSSTGLDAQDTAISTSPTNSFHDVLQSAPPVISVTSANQASATGEESPPVTPAGTSGHRRKNAVVLVVVGAAAAILAPGAWILSKNASSNNFPAEVSSFGLVPLNLTGSGQLTQISVKPGDKVQSGQLLATEANQISNVSVQRDKQILAADQGRLTALQSLLASSGSASESSQSSVNVSQSADVNAANNALRQTEASFAGELAKAQSNLASAQAALNSEQVIFAQQCPNGTNSAGPTLTLAECIAAHNSVVGLQQTVNNAAQTVLTIQANQQQAVVSAQRVLTYAQNQSLMQGSIGSTSDLVQSSIISATSDVAKDQAQLTADQAQLGALVLRAPVAGTIVQVNGALGEQVSAAGVLVSTAQASAVPVPKSTQLFSSNSLVQSNSSAAVPLLLLRSSQPLRISALIPQDKLSSIKVGQTAEFVSSVSGLPNLKLRVSQIGGFSVIANGTASYPVTFDLKSGNTQGYLQGITGTVKFK